MGKIYKILFFSGFLAIIPWSVSASADLMLVPESGSYIINRDFTVSATVNTGGQAINASEGEIVFDKTKFSITSIDASSSIFSIWVKYPSYSNSAGTISFAGGLPSPGFTGTGSLFTIHFKGIALGQGNVNFAGSGSRVLLNDGLGTDIFGQASGGTYTILPEPLTISCSASPSSANTNTNITFKASVSGGVGSYSYSWSGACTGNSANCSSSFSTTGNKTATITVDSGSETKTANCSASIGLPGLNATCTPSAEVADTGEEIIFSGAASGGSGDYTYTWSGDCQGQGQACSSSFDTSGVKTATVSVTSENKASSAVCKVFVGLTCPNEPPGGGTGPRHAVCHNQQCVYVLGEGEDECNHNEDCPAPLPPAETIKYIVNTPAGSVATKTATAVGLFATAPFSLWELFSILGRVLGAGLVALGWRKKNPPWGTVYDSITKQPLDPAYVSLKDLAGKEISSAITDLDGRYGFLADPGKYKMASQKTNYLFPSQKLSGKQSDELYANLYFGEELELKQGEVIIKNIPMDPVNFDWNEFAKKGKKLLKFYSASDLVLRRFYDLIYFAGLTVAAIAYFSAPYPYNLIILIIYLLLLILRLFGMKPKPLGSVRAKESKDPVSFAIVRVFDPETSREIGHKITDKLGRYFCLVPKGRYYVKIEKKNLDGSYSLAYASDLIDASKTGIIKEKFKI